MPRVTGKPLDMEAFNKNKAVLHKALADLDARLERNAFLCGPEQTIADLSAAFELDNGRLSALDLAKYPKVAEWL